MRSAMALLVFFVLSLYLGFGPALSTFIILIYSEEAAKMFVKFQPYIVAISLTLVKHKAAAIVTLLLGYFAAQGVASLMASALSWVALSLFRVLSSASKFGLDTVVFIFLWPVRSLFVANAFKSHFQQMDKDGSGEIDKPEFVTGMKAMIAGMIEKDTKFNDEFFDILFDRMDADDSGSVSITEFTDTISHGLSEYPEKSVPEVLWIMCHDQTSIILGMHKKIDRVTSALKQWSERMDRIEATLEGQTKLLALLAQTSEKKKFPSQTPKPGSGDRLLVTPATDVKRQGSRHQRNLTQAPETSVYDDLESDEYDTISDTVKTLN